VTRFLKNFAIVFLTIPVAALCLIALPAFFGASCDYAFGPSAVPIGIFFGVVADFAFCYAIDEQNK
jgi:hypothetical protein